MMSMQDWIFEKNDCICDVRTVGVLIRNGKILVQRDKDGNEYALPGGHIKLGETLTDGLIREFKEETGADIVPRRMLWSEECFWEWNGKKAHNLSFYHLIELLPGADIPDNGEFVSHKDNCNVLIGWIPVTKLQNIIIYPEFLKEEIHHLDGGITHFVSK